MSQKAGDINIPDTGSQREADPLVRGNLQPGGSLGTWLAVLCTTQEKPYFKFLNVINNNLFPPQNNRIGFFSIAFQKCIFNRTFQNKKFGTNLIKINSEWVTVSNILHSFIFLTKI